MTTYGLFSSSSKFARITRCQARGAGNAEHDRRHPDVLEQIDDAAQSPRRLNNSGENNPVMSMPRLEKAIHIRISASIKLGVATPI